MLLTCDNCQTIFRIDSARLDPDGQRVRCSVCNHSWIAKPVEEEDQGPDDVGEMVRVLRMPIAILLMIVALAAGLITTRGMVTAQLPGLIPIYDVAGLTIRPNLDQLEVQELDADYFGDVLRLKGQLANLGRIRAHAAPLQVRVTDQNGLILATSRITPESRFIEAGGRTEFFVQLDMPPGQQAEINITPLSERVTRDGF